MIMNIAGFAFGSNKGVLLDLLSRHNAEYWFNDKKEIEFCHAIEWNDKKKMEKIMNDGLAINKQGKQGITFIIYAYLKEKKNSYEYLLEHGADPNIIMTTDEKLEGTVVQMKVEFSVLTMAAEDSRDPFYLGMGLKYGGNPNAIVGDVHILHNAIRAESLTNVQLLIEAGTILNGLTNENYGGDFIYNAMTGNQYDIVYYLLQKGANPELRKDDIIFSMNNFIVERLKLKNEDLTPEMRVTNEWRLKVKKILEDRGFDFSDENMKRIKAEINERVRKWQEEMKKKETNK